MKQRRAYRHLVSLGSGFLLLCVLTLEFAYVWQCYYATAIIEPFFRRGNWVVVLIYAVLTAVFFKAYGCLKYGYLKRSDLIYNQVIAITLVNALSYLQVSVIGRHLMSPTPLLVLTLADWVLIVCWSLLFNHLYFWLYPPRQLVIVYGSKHAADLVLKMSARVDKYMVCESLDVSIGYEQIIKELQQFDGVILCDIEAKLRNELVKYCCGHRIRAYVSPKLSDIILRGGEEIRLFDTPLILCRNEGLTIEQRFLKRSFDLLVSAVLLVLLLPILAICALAVKLEDGGSVLYRQRRLTRDGREFDVLKFRSMIPNAEADGKAVLAADHDARITKVGAVLRRFRLDELPQLLNILKGDMSLVGPRPERPELSAEYTKQFPEFAYRLQVKAGLTGYAQVTGTYDTGAFDKLKMDLMYIEQYSFVLDLQILLMTIKTALFPPKTNAAEGLTMTDYKTKPNFHPNQSQKEKQDE